MYGIVAILHKWYHTSDKLYLLRVLGLKKLMIVFNYKTCQSIKLHIYQT